MFAKVLVVVVVLAMVYADISVPIKGKPMGGTFGGTKEEGFKNEGSRVGVPISKGGNRKGGPTGRNLAYAAVPTLGLAGGQYMDNLGRMVIPSGGVVPTYNPYLSYYGGVYGDGRFYY